MNADTAIDMLKTHVKVTHKNHKVRCVLMNDGSIVYNFAQYNGKIRVLLPNNDWGNEYDLGKDCIIVDRIRNTSFTETWEISR